MTDLSDPFLFPETTTGPVYLNTAKVRRYMAAHGRRYDWLAAQIGCSRSHLAHVMAGRRRIRRSQAGALAWALGVLFDDVILAEEPEREREAVTA